ncbi:MAG: hypothetical protein KF817_05710 [Phycisphaeraceae bacterium]|nr:hypothetical protein [Phycisphaeraceae bacterium]
MSALVPVEQDPDRSCPVDPFVPFVFFVVNRSGFVVNRSGSSASMER